MSNSGSGNLNSKYAWRELAHQDLPKRSAPERVMDFLEIYGLLDENSAREQASRCIQCPNPSCMDGCPLCNPIPQWMLLTAEGRFLEAAAVLGSVSNMAEICCRLCASERHCESTCIVGSTSEPVAIRAIEQFLSEYALAHGHAETSTAPPNGLRVAIVGSGPGCLACADELAKRGYAVTVFDSALIPGGLLVNGMPAFKLDNSLVQRRIDILQKRGVIFRLGIHWTDRDSTTVEAGIQPSAAGVADIRQLAAATGQLGTPPRRDAAPPVHKPRTAADTGLTLASLRKDFDAVFLGLDSRQSRPLNVVGADLNGVVQSVPFILQKNTALGLELPPLELAGKRVAVLGGGDTAIDCARTAIRCQAREVICVYRREESDLPCTRHEYDNAVEEGVRFLFRAAPQAVLGNAAGCVTGLRLIRTEMVAAEPGGRRTFKVQHATEFELETDFVIPALGFEPLPCPELGGFNELALDERGGIVVDDNLLTSLPGVFAGGDIVRGPSLVLHAVRDGRKAATQIDAFLAAAAKAKT